MPISAVPNDATPALGTDPTAPLAGLKEESAKHQAETRAGVRALESSSRRAEARIAAEEARAGKTTPPKLELAPPPQVQQTDPLQMFGSAAMVFAALGSLLTRQPATTALNAAAGVINGYRRHDMEMANQAFQQWKVATDNALRLHDYQMEIYKLAMGDIQRREGLALELGQQEHRDILAGVQANAAAFKDQVMIDVAQSHGIQGVEKLVADRAKSAEALRKSQLFGMEQKAALDAYHEWEQSPEGQHANAHEKFLKMLEYTDRLAPTLSKSPAIQAQKDLAAKKIAEGIKNGNQPPILTGLYGLSGQVRSELESQDVNLAMLQLDWEQAKKQVSTLNSPQMVRFTSLAHSVVNTIDEVRGLSEQLQLSGVPRLNHLGLRALVETQGNTPQGQMAARYLAAVNTLKEEFANLAQGGYAPTEAVWKLANDQINADYGVRELGSSLNEVQRLIKYRIQAIPGFSEHGPGTSRYLSSEPHHTGALGWDDTTNPAARAPAAAEAPGAPKVGAVVDGYRFKGGDPSKKENWEKE